MSSFLYEVHNQLEEARDKGQASAAAFIAARTLMEEAITILQGVDGPRTSLEEPTRSFIAVQKGIGEVLKPLVAYPPTINPWLEQIGMPPLDPIEAPLSDFTPQALKSSPPVKEHKPVKRSSDLHRRLPRFRDALASIKSVELQGGLEGLPSGVLERLESIEPVGLDDKRHLVLPDNYDPAACSPVLMLLPYELMPITLDPHPAELMVANRLVTASGGKSPLRSIEVATARLDSSAAAWVYHLNMRVDATSTFASDYNVLSPRLTFVNYDTPFTHLGPVLAHEADHLDFFLRQAPCIQPWPGSHYSIDELKTIAEKRAYQTDRRVELNLGKYANLGSLDALSTSYKGIGPSEVQSVYDDLYSRCAGTSISVPALAALAIEQLFGDANWRVTRAEVEAFRAAKLIT